MDLHAILETAVDASRKAGVVLRQHGAVTESHEKSAYHFVTEADLRAEKVILDLIAQRFPGHRIVSEESHAAENTLQPNVWIIDPLDGTNNFSHSIPLYCVSIAFASEGQVKVAAIYDPNRDEMYTAVRGQGAWLNGTPIHVSPRGELRSAIICTGFYYDRGQVMRSTLKAIETLFVQGVRGIRRFGSAALDLCWVATGQLDGFFEYQLAPWDYAAGWLLVEEAGGICSERDGRAMSLEAGNVIAANHALHSKLVELVAWSKMNGTK